MPAVISITDLTQDDLDLLSDLLNEYLENFDAEEEHFNGIDDPQARYDAVESLYGRFIDVDLSGAEQPLHHPDCLCEWCEIGRGR
ncbi:hypothetical protein B0F88_1149 [Methylobacter tundripaludum]|uniref:Uncharacterized protein n=1 Tax=Methylobacter tundripaludum TaxID=173365 RepID=A0A2S6GPS7_9GAMM|nr:hypothetical protein [Methylobacter tundripaludum]PPK67262.1 hypothetical protein B0F88_1149 [Methylobacter tundripaludum]